MKKKQNLLLLVLAVLFVSLFSGSTAVSAASFPRLEIARTGEIVSKNNNLYYRYSKRNYARNKYFLPWIVCIPYQAFPELSK